jgi:hypothetical protein
MNICDVRDEEDFMLSLLVDDTYHTVEELQHGLYWRWKLGYVEYRTHQLNVSTFDYTFRFFVKKRLTVHLFPHDPRVFEYGEGIGSKFGPHCPMAEEIITVQQQRKML